MSKFSIFILFIAIIIAIIPLYYYKYEEIMKIIFNNNKDINTEDKKRYILNEKNSTLENEIKNKYIELKNEMINYKNNNTYLKYERDAIEKIKELEKERKAFEEFENNVNEEIKIDFKENELKNLTDLIDRYILSEN